MTARIRRPLVGGARRCRATVTSLRLRVVLSAPCSGTRSSLEPSTQAQTVRRVRSVDHPAAHFGVRAQIPEERAGVVLQR